MKILINFFFFSFLSLLTFSQNIELNKAISELKNDPYMQAGSWGLMVVNCASGECIAQYNADSMLIPASVTKLFSTSLALETLGDTFAFRTGVFIHGDISTSGTLNGDIWIEGGADPTIGLKYFGAMKFVDALYESLQNQGIDTVRGNLIGQAMFFDSLLIPETYPEDDYGNYYGAGSSALIWDGNRVEFVFKTSASTGYSTTLLSFFPPFDSLKVDNQTKSGRKGTGDNSIVWGGPYEFNRMIDGTLPPGKSNFKVYASSPDPALGFVLALRYYLEKKGIVFIGDCESRYSCPIPDDAELIMTYKSPILKDIIAFINTYSHNVSAETIFKMAAKQLYDNASYQNALIALDSFLLKTVGDSLNYEFHDGSGLSKANRVSAKTVACFLQEIRNYHWFEVLYASMPIAGKTGTLRSMFRGSVAEGKLRAKSGYMKTVRAYSGYVENHKRETIAFSVIVNHYKGNAYTLKKKLEKLMIAIAKSE